MTEQTLSETLRPPTSEERRLARECGRVMMSASHFMSEVAANEAQVSDWLIERMKRIAGIGNNIEMAHPKISMP